MLFRSDVISITSQGAFELPYTRTYVDGERTLDISLYELEQQKAHDEEAAKRKSQIGTGDRSEKIRQMAERGSVGRASISDQLKAGKAAAEQAKAERPPKEKSSRSAER